MIKRFCLLKILLAEVTALGDLLVSDFENGTKPNSIGGDRYYFNDAHDGGASEITGFFF